MKLLLATTSQGKLGEYRSLLPDRYELVTPVQLGLTVKVPETAPTYEENARLKATTFTRLSRLAVLADDSGLEVTALGGKPGIHSARFAGEGARDEDNIALLLGMLKGIAWEKRVARFVCVIAIAEGDRVETCAGECSGIITFQPQGSFGFGYDPVFYFPELGKTMAELPPEVKNQVSHRGKAARKAAIILDDILARDC